MYEWVVMKIIIDLEKFYGVAFQNSLQYDWLAEHGCCSTIIFIS